MSLCSLLYKMKKNHKWNRDIWALLFTYGALPISVLLPSVKIRDIENPRKILVWQKNPRTNKAALSKHTGWIRLRLYYSNYLLSRMQRRRCLSFLLLLILSHFNWCRIIYFKVTKITLLGERVEVLHPLLKGIVRHDLTLNTFVGRMVALALWAASSYFRMYII